MSNPNKQDILEQIQQLLQEVQPQQEQQLAYNLNAQNVYNGLVELMQNENFMQNNQDMNNLDPQLQNQFDENSNAYNVLQLAPYFQNFQEKGVFNQLANLLQDQNNNNE